MSSYRTFSITFALSLSAYLAALISDFLHLSAWAIFAFGVGTFFALTMNIVLVAMLLRRPPSRSF